MRAAFGGILVYMHISAKADYAARALIELARDTTRPLTCEAIASSQEIPFRFLKSVVGELRRTGLVRSQRGCEGVTGSVARPRRSACSTCCAPSTANC